ncbi:type IV pilus biogenesis protein PilM [Asaia sp. SF2.1]|uniref:type IV pilus biogenesis protein PilM n=1 Tax=Asaia sp. SF2.1 TaxID=406101 RepID=UPI0003D3A33C|nr:type IV pilus biogenesis protein PilM [Asaia sp. SF2.1]ETC99460.1 hypothetical protein P792_03180 [Asaia sp. SF2.1]
MAAFVFLGLALIVLFRAEIASDRTIYKGLFPQTQNQTGAGYAFLAYKNAVQFYVSDHPGLESGAIPLSALALDSGVTTLISPGNTIIRSDAGTTIVTWAAPQAGLIDAVMQASQGDRSIGTSSGTRWSTPYFGDMGSIPAPVPTGDIVSVVTFTGTGYSN